MRAKRATPIHGASAYLRRDAEVNRLRSGIGVDCTVCGERVDNQCKSKRGKTLLYNHGERRRAGKAAADALVLARRATEAK